MKVTLRCRVIFVLSMASYPIVGMDWTENPRNPVRLRVLPLQILALWTSGKSLDFHSRISGSTPDGATKKLGRQLNWQSIRPASGRLWVRCPYAPLHFWIVAQQVEWAIVNRLVVGSSPTFPANFADVGQWQFQWAVNPPSHDFHWFESNHRHYYFGGLS